MNHKTWKRALAFAAAALALVLATGWQPCGAVSGDPDDDGLPTWGLNADAVTVLDAEPLLADADADGLLDGWEVNILNTNPAVADSETLDSDSGGTPDGVELANGANPLSDADDGRIPFYPTPDTPAAADSLAYDEVPGFVFSASVGAFDGYQIQFDGSAKFDSPVAWNVTAAMTPPFTPTAALWKLVTQEGPVVYWRVRGVQGTTAPGRRFVSSAIRWFRLTGGPALAGPADMAEQPCSSSPTFSWSGTGFTGYRVVFSSLEKPGVRVVWPFDGTWSAATSWRFAAPLKWRRINLLGRNVIWRVVGRDAEERYAYSEWRKLVLTGGPTGLSATVSGDAANPENVPTFEADIAGFGQYSFVFSGTADFASPVFWTGWIPAGSYAPYQPPMADWQSITALGPVIYWVARGYDATGLSHGWSEIQGYEIGTGQISVGGKTVPPGLNGVAPGLVSLAFTDVMQGASHEVAFCGDARLGGPKATAPTDTATSWDMDPDPDPPATAMPGAATPLGVAGLETAYPYLAVKGLTGSGYSFFSPAYLLTSTEYLRAPALKNLGGAVMKSTAYNVSWDLSEDDGQAPPRMLYYELQEAKNSAFTTALKSYKIAAGATSKSFRHREVTGTVYFYYRVRAVNSVGHSAWSEIDSKRINGGIIYKGMPQPFAITGNNLILDNEEKNNGNMGSIRIVGPGWKPFEWYASYKGTFHYISAGNNPNGSEEFYWIPNIKQAGAYEVWVSFFTSSNRSLDAPYTVKSKDGSQTFKVNQNWPVQGQGNLIWANLGVFNFAAGTAGYVKLADNHYPAFPTSECADAVGFRYLGPSQ